jgi:hypothetical protein
LIQPRPEDGQDHLLCSQITQKAGSISIASAENVRCCA